MTNLQFFSEGMLDSYAQIANRKVINLGIKPEEKPGKCEIFHPETPGERIVIGTQSFANWTEAEFAT